MLRLALAAHALMRRDLPLAGKRFAGLACSREQRGLDDLAAAADYQLGRFPEDRRYKALAIFERHEDERHAAIARGSLQRLRGAARGKDEQPARTPGSGRPASGGEHGDWPAIRYA